MSLRTSIHCGIEAVYQGSALFADASLQLSLAAAAVIRMESGTAAGLADKLYAAELTIAASGSQNLDLNGVLLDAFGAVFSPAKVRAILIEADAANANNVEIGGAAATAFLGWFKDATDILVMSPGDRILLSSRSAGKAVGAGTADLLKVANAGAGTSVKLRVVIVGTSA